MTKPFKKSIDSTLFPAFNDSISLFDLFDLRCEVFLQVKLMRWRRHSGRAINFDAQRELNKNQVLRLADYDFIDKKENMLITRSTGVGRITLLQPLAIRPASWAVKKVSYPKK